MGGVDDFSEQLASRCWDYIVAYINVDFRNPSLDLDEVAKLMSLLVEACMKWMDVARSMFFADDWEGLLWELQGGESLADLARQHHPDLKRACEWLVTRRPGTSNEAISFLRKQKDYVVIEYGEADYDKSDAVKPFFWETVVQFVSIIAPICYFIWEKMEEHDAAYDWYGESPPTKFVPLRLCQEPECGRFTVILKDSKRFCSDKCRMRFNRRTPEEARNYKKEQKRKLAPYAAITPRYPKGPHVL